MLRIMYDQLVNVQAAAGAWLLKVSLSRDLRSLMEQVHVHGNYKINKDLSAELATRVL